MLVLSLGYDSLIYSIILIDKKYGNKSQKKNDIIYFICKSIYKGNFYL